MSSASSMSTPVAPVAPVGVHSIFASVVWSTQRQISSQLRKRTSNRRMPAGPRNMRAAIACPNGRKVRPEHVELGMHRLAPASRALLGNRDLATQACTHTRLSQAVLQAVALRCRIVRHVSICSHRRRHRAECSDIELVLGNGVPPQRHAAGLVRHGQHVAGGLQRASDSCWSCRHCRDWGDWRERRTAQVALPRTAER